MAKLLVGVLLCVACSPPPSPPRTGTTGGPTRPPRDACATIRCAANMHCVAEGARAECVANDAIPSRDPCARFTCAAGTHCVSPDDRPRCVADTP